MHEFLFYLTWAILWYFVILSLGYILLLFASVPDIFGRFKEIERGNILTLMASKTLPPITVVVPAYNEEEVILESVSSVLKSDYPNTQLIVVNDGSTDTTLDKLIKAFDLYKITSVVQQKVKTYGEIRGYYISQTHSNIVVIDKEKPDRSDALNVGINACRTPLLVTLDADTLVEKDALSKAVFHVLTHPHTVALGCGVYVLNGCTFKDGEIEKSQMSLKPLYAFQTCEYFRSFLFSRSGWNAFKGSLCYAGAFTVLERQAVIDAGGFQLDNPAQDFEIITHLHAYGHEHNYPYNIAYLPSAVAWTDVPGTIGSYWKQRSNWQFGTLKSLFTHIRMFFNPRYGITGLFTYPFFLLGEALGCVIEVIAYITIFIGYYLSIIDVYTTILFFLICWGVAALLTMSTALMNFITFNKYRNLSDLPWIFFYGIIENLGFRQFYVICRFIETIKYPFRAMFSKSEK